jgi:hypothetical protein
VGDDFPQEYLISVERNIDISGLEVVKEERHSLERSLP